MVQSPVTKIDPSIASRLSKQRYQLVGEHGGVKVCHWTKQSLIADRSCYKGTFYGIESHGCMQMAPNVDTCNLGCTYCWREPHSDTLNKIDDDPYELYLESVRGHRRLLTGYGGNPKADREKWLEAQNPKHVAISLNGEPTLYSRLGEFLDICHQHGTSTFLVTNGSLPKVIENLDPLPTQLYVSVDAPNKEIFDRICKPKFDQGAFHKLEQTLELLPSLDTRTVCRHTLIKNESMGYTRTSRDWITSQTRTSSRRRATSSLGTAGTTSRSITCPVTPRSWNSRTNWPPWSAGRSCRTEGRAGSL